ncbi:MAG: hypothetical protein A3I88_01135 [Candidatus Portnoybacteria bacterium RIFCSPLOWO2_12_FULL_39_9]|uniref:Uncharacterized protein n=1 Tax=Candidatus Portnoybacteria bacterium RIFCSPHIGHO2_12_FULL_38_9 TaxID=1801997 RepID=A0A1G2FHD9_9BACT|nr:MAG: hypothetical protein A3H00_01560 [Candidatus Portnoybacteria bacterium RBG_13_40_8]OGZ36589.1 MAG: hypothetical protein A2646_00195 [Candidatus Portnoybacteria bacterium RIFCSPHIGHO2_02_FULL_39_12]OGZ37483.1 MAG: hypothetical protein A3J64_00620 [Candidatus Portnoybacteria bacterium RIFCSPHIGHO2_12_FULL_38_9]OGZ39129.1 MAG: hypothetical protein A3F21_00195 [Candidatus Portnoybacteria bacterium RIFCSPLOWO2_01_FULL_38_39]OGZ39823.1 MAG: hypothetical protein A3I88_01135 [Candidatus Portnoy
MPQIITLPKTEYLRLRRIADLFEVVRKLFEVDFFAEPPTKDSKKIIKEFQKTGLYNEAFLKSLEKGLKESSYFRSR